MKRIGIISDTHGCWDEKYEYYFGECDEIWHAGDIGSIEVADKFGFTQSKQYWSQMPNDPVFAGGMKDSCNHRFSFFLTNNHNRDFYNTLINTPEGETVGEYLVKGNLYV